MLRRLRMMLLTMCVVSMALACAPPQLNADGSIPQNPPFGSNGITTIGTDLLLADLYGGQILRFDPNTGHISQRWRADDGLPAADDLLVAPDGSIVFTSPGLGIVGVIHPAQAPQVLMYVGAGVNPIALDPSGTSVIVGFGADARTRVLRVPLDGSPFTVIADDLPTLNSFSIGPDGALWAPTGGVFGAFGGGGVIRVDLATGASQQIPLKLPDGSTGVKFAVATKWAPGIGLLLLQGVDAAIYLVDPTTGTTTLYADLPSDIGDNLVATPDGTIYATGFTGAVMRVDPDRSVHPVAVGS